jgi:phage shock protein A
MQFIDRFLIYLFVWLGAPLLLAVLAIGPRRFWKGVKRAWSWLWQKRLDPEEVLNQVVKQQEKLVAGLGEALARAEQAAQEIRYNIQKSEANIAAHEQEAQQLAGKDDLGCRAVLYKLNLEQMAVQSFRQQLERQQNHISDVRRHLYLVELQLRQYEVGRSILLSQLAEAKTIEQQTSIAAHFDPFNAVANWKQAEGMVQEKNLNARASERVYADLMDEPLANQTTSVDPRLLEDQLTELKARAGKVDNTN